MLFKKVFPSSSLRFAPWLLAARCMLIANAIDGEAYRRGGSGTDWARGGGSSLMREDGHRTAKKNPPHRHQAVSQQQSSSPGPGSFPCKEVKEKKTTAAAAANHQPRRIGSD